MTLTMGIFPYVKATNTLLASPLTLFDVCLGIFLDFRILKSMGDTGFEPVTSSLSRMHSTTELIARSYLQ
jgi:hypothetical protein